MKLWSKEPVSVFVKDGGKLVEKKALVQFEVLFHRAGEKFFATVVNKIENIHEIAPLFNPTISMSGARVEIGDTFKQHLSIIIQPDSKITLVSTHLANYDESGPVWGQERAHVLIFENGYTLDRYALVRFEASKRKGDDGDIVTVKRILGLQDEQVNDNHVVIGSVHDDLNFNSLINNFVKKIGELKRTKYNTLYFGESDGVASTLLLNKVDFVTVYSTVNMKSISIKRSVLDKLEKVQDFRKEAYFPLLALFWPEP